MENHIKEIRIRKGLSQIELARRVQISKSYLSSIENNHRNISIRLAVRIAKALDSSLDEIFLY